MNLGCGIDARLANISKASVAINANQLTVN